MDVIIVLLAVSLILFFGFFAEFVFRRFSIPDVLFLIILGFIIGPHVLGYITPDSLVRVAPVFTTFTLLFLLFDGAFSIHLSSLIREFSHSFVLTIFNFFISACVITLIMWLAGYQFLISLLTGFLLGGVSSSFVIPILKQVKIPEKLYSLLTLESALTDVFCIVFSLTVIEIFKLGSFGFQQTFSQLVSLFAVAGMIGIAAGIVWIILILRVFKERNYMMTIAYLIIVYVLTELLQGNGAIAALFFGLMLKNSRQLSTIVGGITHHQLQAKNKSKNGPHKSGKFIGIAATTPSEEFFYHQVSFLLKTFFFVYVGVLINISDWKALLIGIIISVVLMFSRMASLLLTRKMEDDYKNLVNSIFARGLAAAAVAQLAIQAGIPNAPFIAEVAYVAITGTIILSSVRVFLVKVKLPKAKVKLA